MGGVVVDCKVVGKRIRSVREAKNVSQEDLAAMIDSSSVHVSNIERGQKVPKLDKFVAIANALEVSADLLLIDVIDSSSDGVAKEINYLISDLPKREQLRVLNIVRAFVKEE